MKRPSFIRETFIQVKQSPVWGVAFLATLLLPLMLIYARAGIEICCGIIGVSFLWHSWRTRQWGWVRRPFTLLCTATWLWLVLVVTPLALKPEAGLIEALCWFRLPLMFASVRYWVLAQPSARSMLGVLLGVLCALITLDCYWQFFSGVSLSGHERLYSGRLTGPLDSAKIGNYLGNLVVPTVAFCLEACLRIGSRRAAAACLLGLVFAIGAILLSGERSPLLTVLLACGATLGLLMMCEKHLRFYGMLSILAVAAFLFAFYAGNPWVQIRIDAMFGVMQHYWQSDYGMMAATGIAIGREHLLHGVGLHGFRDLCPVLTYLGTQFQPLHPHNYYIEWFAEAGLPGLLFFVAMGAALLRESVQHLLLAQGLARLLPAIALGAMLQHFFPLMGMQSFFTNWGAMLQWYSLSLVFAALHAGYSQSNYQRDVRE